MSSSLIYSTMELWNISHKVVAEIFFVAQIRAWGLLSRNWRRSGTARAANGVAVLPIVVVGRVDVAGAVEVEVVGLGAIRVRGRRPIAAVVAGVGEQIGILVDVAAP